LMIVQKFRFNHLLLRDRTLPTLVLGQGFALF